MAVLQLKIHWLLLVGLTEQVPVTKSEENELILQLCVMYMLICRWARLKGERHVIRFCFYKFSRKISNLGSGGVLQRAMDRSTKNHFVGKRLARKQALFEGHHQILELPRELYDR